MVSCRSRSDSATKAGLSHVYGSWLAAVGLGWTQLTLLFPAPCGLLLPIKGSKACSYFTVMIRFQVSIKMYDSLEALTQN